MVSDRQHPPASSANKALQEVAAGAGPFLQRDYWGVVAECRFRPSEVIELLRTRFPELPPPDMAVFTASRPLEIGDDIEIAIPLSGPCQVRVVHRDACSLTFATLEGHPEAGRITFGAYRNDRDDVIFHVRSRARSRNVLTYVGFWSGGDPMQTTTWTDLVNNIAITCGRGVHGFVTAETRRLDPSCLEPGDTSMDRPTFLARGD